MFSSNGSQSGAANYIEDVFSTWLYTGNGATQTITNRIDLSTKGGLVWGKPRNQLSDHFWVDTVRGANNWIRSNTTNVQAALATVSAFGTTGFTVDAAGGYTNDSSINYVGWSFRKQPKFFDIVTYTGNGANRTIAHNLGSVPGCIIVKSTDAAADWQVYHRSLANTEYLVLNSTVVVATGATRWNSTTPTSTVFSLGTSTAVNASGGTYVAYVFAHDAGGFGLTGTDNVISCGILAAGVTSANLGWEPQFVLAKATTTAFDWQIFDSMRGLPALSAGFSQLLNANSPSAEASQTNGAVNINATGFNLADLIPSTPRIYIAIRRGPMGVPTTGTQVYNAVDYTGNAAIRTIAGGAQTDLFINQQKVTTNHMTGTRLTGPSVLQTESTSAEDAATYSTYIGFDSMTGINYKTSDPFTLFNSSPVAYIQWQFRRAPCVFDVVCYTGTGANTTQTHNLGAAPELMIVKSRSNATAWQVYSSALVNFEYVVLNTTAAKATGATRWDSTTPTSTVFSIGTATEVNASAETYVAYLFATCPGVSKVGSYTGTAALLTVNCGFAAGARFVLIKRTDSTGDWYVYDSVRGITSGNDPYLLLNSAAAEVTGTNYVDTDTTGFKVTAAAPAGLNASGGTYIFLAMA